jgi:hypothetical protein
LFGSLRRATITLTHANSTSIGIRVFGRRFIFQLRHQAVVLEFDSPGQGSRFEFRVRVHGRPARGTVQFSGVVVHQLAVPVTARFRPAELHIGEKLSLLVSLVRERTADLYGALRCRVADLATDAAERHSSSPRRLRIAVAPFSNSSTRDWPATYYGSLISLLLERLSCEVVLVGTTEQVAQALEITNHIQSPGLTNLVGQTTWDEIRGLLQAVDLVICNNSGIAHLAAALGSKVLAIYSGSHQPREWGPRGTRAWAIMLEMPCSPCGFESVAECTAEHACMRQITPAYVLSQAEAILAITTHK